MQDYSLRYAAAHSLDGLRDSLGHDTKMPDALRVSYWLAIYQVLVDDDDEIRDIGAAVVSRSLLDVLSINSSIVPAVARERLRSYLLREHSKSEILAVESMDRLTGQYSGSARKFPKRLMAEATQEQNELFYKERQNLYIDEVSEAKIWSSLLRQTISIPLPETTKVYLNMFVEEGLEVLKSNAEESLDGPLGWTSKEEVFTLGMRIIHASHVVLEWQNRTESGQSNVRESLEEVLAIGQRTSLHPLWLHNISLILEASRPV